MRSGSGRHRRPRQAPAVVVAAGVTGAGMALPLFAASGAQAADGAVWDRVAECESGGAWSANEGSGYYGGFQLTQRTWEQYGGTVHADRPDLASRGQQIAVAEAILAAEGPDAWPSCAVTSGLAAAVNGVTETPAPQPPPAPGGPDGRGDAEHPAEGTPKPGAPGTDAPDATGTPAPDAGTDAAPGARNPGPGERSDAESDGPSDGATGQPGQTPGQTPTETPTGVPGDAPGDSSAPDVDSSTPGGPSAPDVDSSAPDEDSDGGTEGTGRHRGDRDPRESGREAADRSERGSGRHAAPAEPAVEYLVAAGDSLSGIAAEQGVDGGWPALYAANASVVGADPDLILPGQELQLPSIQD
ncbi:transglycosylase family protein [Streptomyces sp. JJ38]|uniref:transglycosylase family protein n=1 Tax=Streptomyces sp. JJ38 TaxID=2738128 RepID=UPI001C55BCF0|nr:transglycosylase family protein [Streptomyces sp. JJ38]MBW1595775.1 LysM peptidoglycan-binding domain-containing protein [Streptomyces sp. JJ38]